jgi:hypothetical protein
VKIYSFAGCVMAGASFLTKFLPGYQPTMLGISTEGVIRLLSGETLSIDEQQLNQIKSSNKELEDNFGVYYPINIEEIECILWTSISDATYFTNVCKCPDKSCYPFYDGVINKGLGSGGFHVLSVPLLEATWNHFIYLTRLVPIRIVINYPTKFLLKSSWLDRINLVQYKAEKLFMESGWGSMWVYPELGRDGYWAHYSDSVLTKLYRDIEEKLTIL